MRQVITCAQWVTLWVITCSSGWSVVHTSPSLTSLRTIIENPLFNEASAQSPLQNVLATSTYYDFKEPSHIDLVYIGPGDPVYSLFGHVALRVQRGDQDEIYDFGITQAVRGGGDLKSVILGRAKFWGEVRSFQRMLKSWKRRDRTVQIYPLNLPSRLAQRLVSEMQWRVGNHQKVYLYDPIRENCAIQIRSLLDSLLGGVVYETSQNLKRRYRSFRNDTRHNYSKQWTLSTLIEFFTGPTLDQPRDLWDLSYRPKTLVNLLSRVYMGAQPLLGKVRILYQRTGADPHDGFSMGVVFLWILISCALIILGVWGVKWKSSLPISPLIPLMILICFSSMIGGLGWWLSAQSLWLEVRSAWVLICFSPLDLWLCLLAFKPSSQLVESAQFYLLSRLGLAVFAWAILSTWFSLSLSLIPLIFFSAIVVCSMCFTLRIHDNP